MNKKRPKICTCCKVSEAKFYSYHSTKIAKARPGFNDQHKYPSVQINFSCPWLIWPSISFDLDNEVKFNILSGKKHFEEILGYLSKLTILSSYLLLRLNWIYSGRCILDLDFLLEFTLCMKLNQELLRNNITEEKKISGQMLFLFYTFCQEAYGTIQVLRQNAFGFLGPPQHK